MEVEPRRVIPEGRSPLRNSPAQPSAPAAKHARPGVCELPAVWRAEPVLCGLVRKSEQMFAGVAFPMPIALQSGRACAVPQFRPKPMLERSATADLFKNTL